jgi:hypothetical protein
MAKFSEKVRENYFRRWAKRLGVELQKSSGKKWNVNNQMGYRIYDPTVNNVLLGVNWELTLDEVAAWFEENEKEMKEIKS